MGSNTHFVVFAVEVFVLPVVAVVVSIFVSFKLSIIDLSNSLFISQIILIKLTIQRCNQWPGKG